MKSTAEYSSESIPNNFPNKRYYIEGIGEQSWEEIKILISSGNLRLDTDVYIKPKRKWLRAALIPGVPELYRRSHPLNVRKTIGWPLIILGIIGIVSSLNMDTSVGSIGGQRIHNLSLASQQMNYIVVSCLCLLIGVILTVLGANRAGSTSAPPSSNESGTKEPRGRNAATLLASTQCVHCQKYYVGTPAYCPNCGTKLTMVLVENNSTSDEKETGKNAIIAKRAFWSHSLLIEGVLLVGIPVIIISFVFILTTVNSTRSVKEELSVKTPSSVNPSAEAPAPSVNSKPENWIYEEFFDVMTNRAVREAHTLSAHTFSFGFPYEGPQHATLTLRSHPRYGKHVILEIEKGTIFDRH